MSHWVRLWEDMPTDPKWRVIAARSSRPLTEVIALFVLMMTNAGLAKERGTLSGWDDEDAAAALGMKKEHVTAIIVAMQGKTLDGARLKGWSNRQCKREDGSAARMRLWRDRKSGKVVDLTPRK